MGGSLRTPSVSGSVLGRMRSLLTRPPNRGRSLPSWTTYPSGNSKQSHGDPCAPQGWDSWLTPQCLTVVRVPGVGRYGSPLDGNPRP